LLDVLITEGLITERPGAEEAGITGQGAVPLGSPRRASRCRGMCARISSTPA
jgi:hypothetical protein